ncbi:MAG: HNH endonuclease [Burkholderiaceae bacterium]
MSAARMLQRPIFGGPFGHGRYALATLPTVSNGLHAVRFMVIEPRRGTVLSVADDKAQAIASARRLLVALPAPDAANDGAWQQATLWPELPVDRPPKVRSISRRRREVFERSQGACHYCRTPLTLDGRWHVEHMVPQALGGEDTAANLVAACVPCNLAKRDRTALEFAFVTAGDPLREQSPDA